MDHSISCLCPNVVCLIKEGRFFFGGGVGGVGEEGVDNSLPTLKWNVVFLNLKKKPSVVLQAYHTTFIFDLTIHKIETN